MKKLFVIVLLAVAWAGAQIALAQSPSPAPDLIDPGLITDVSAWGQFAQMAPPWLTGAVPLLVAFMVLARGLSEALLFFAAKTKTNADDDLGNILAKIADVLGQVLGHVGVGMPKTMILAKAEKIQAKEDAGGGGTQPN